MKTFTDMKPQGVVKFVLYAALLAGMYYSAYTWLIQRDWPREDYNYCYLIPLVVLYLIWEKKDELAAEQAVPSWGGLLFLIPGLLLFWVGELAGEMYSLYISSWLVAVGIFWMHIGWRKLKVIAFALFMALTMFPLPNFLNTKLTFGLKLISSQLGVALIHLYGLSAYREGNVIDLGFTQLQVVDACSGLRYLFPLLVLGILLAYFYRAALWKRLVLVLSTIPLTIITNSLRIALTGIIYKYWGAAAAEGFFHGFSGWLIFMFTLGVLLAEIWVLRRIAPGPSESLFARPAPSHALNSLLQPGEGGSKSFFSPLQFIVAAVLLILTLGISMGVEFREKMPASKSFSQFPLTVGSWEGTRQFMGQDLITSLDLNDYTNIDYKNISGQRVDFYVAWYESQRKNQSIHSPETCLPAGGWLFRQAGNAQVALADGRSMTVSRAIMEKGENKNLVYFWFPARGRVLTNAWELKLYTFWDALTRQRTDGALVRVITPVYANESPERAEVRLQQFIKEVNPVLNEYLPK
ncbi:MAG TPA: VPLPA-CTERM-specific exosortase XrtD [Syntrophales bacterium]|nr:VPLPA-CTERM-specific exosortase XrtD [Syntrophales bacterium]HPI56336.1 VPLPA-CTERM-specific exosortase XrtD [Syntrophales bacterium]HPN24276.1 VPLPA-CTERM-specific exosortase XrtD [Syntrophales bacterium]HQM28629.1 VPLPA-CTERM-specific exosortase XrtD [Syntrophales bacterium]